MFRLLLLLAASLGLGLAFAVADKLRGPVARLVRSAVLTAAATLAVIGIGTAIVGLLSDAWWAILIGAAILAMAARLAWPVVKGRRGPGGNAEHVPLTRPSDPRWSRFESGLDWRSRQQARRSRASIEGFVAEQDSPSLTHEHNSLLLSFERRVPELIDTCLERCRNADRTEQRRYLDETLDRIVQIGNEAERARREIREADDQRLQVLHRYFDGISGGSDENPRAR